MWVNQIFSLIKDKTVENIIVCNNYEEANQLAVSLYGQGAMAVDTTQFPLSIGCKYFDGHFYQPDGVSEVPRNPTEAEEIASLKGESGTLTEYIIDLDYRLSLEELGV